MTTKLEQAARQALEALETDEQWGFVNKKVLERRLPAITALREALKVTESNISDHKLAEQAEQEPVAWARTSESGEVLDCISHTYKVTQPCTVDYDEPLYAAPVRTKDLTDDEIADALYGKGCWRLGVHPDHLREYRRVIAAYKEKNK